MKKMQKMTLTNNFHNTSCVIFANSGSVFSHRRRMRVKNQLCPSPECTCGDAFGMRGPQDGLPGNFAFDSNGDGSYTLIEF